jgi:hypothetical protein
MRQPCQAGIGFLRAPRQKSMASRIVVLQLSPGPMTQLIPALGHQSRVAIPRKCLISILRMKADTYVWRDLSAASFAAAADPEFDRRKITRGQREYAIAGALHLDHLAQLNRSEANRETIAHEVYKLSQSLALPEAEVSRRLACGLDRHSQEWQAFLAAAGPQSLLADWTNGGRP